MGKSRFLTLSFAVLVSVLSCAPSIVRHGDYGKVVIAYGSASSASGRSLETGWPGATLPEFASVQVSVSGDGMSTVTAGASGSSGKLSIQVPAGAGRLVEISAIPAAGGAAPYFAKKYGGSAIVDIAPGETKSVAISLGLSETKIPLCAPSSEPWNWFLASADSLNGTLSLGADVSLYFFSDIEFDDYGRLFVSSDNWGIQRFSSLSAYHETVLDNETFTGGLAYQKSTGRLFFTYSASDNFDATSLAYIDPGTDDPVDVSLPPMDFNLISAIAADDSAVFVGLGYTGLPFLNAAAVYRVAVDAQGNGTYGASYSLYSESESGLSIQDMIVRDGVLYIAENNMIALLPLAEISGEGIPSLATSEVLVEETGGPGFGRIIALDAATLKYLGSVEWPYLTEPTSWPADYFFGPLRFLGFGKGKLYVADAGLRLESQETEGDDFVLPPEILGRVVEMDTKTLAITGYGQTGSAIPMVWFLDVN